MEKGFSAKNEEECISLFLDLIEKNTVEPDSPSVTKALLIATKYNNLYLNQIVDYIDKNKVKIDYSLVADDFVSAIKENQHQYMDSLLKYIDKYELYKSFEHLQYIFNYSMETGKNELTNDLDTKYSIIQKSFSNKIYDSILLEEGSYTLWADLESDGTLDMTNCFDDDLKKEEIEKAHYSKNPILFNLENFNPKILDSLFERNYEIDSSLMVHALVKSVYAENKEAYIYLLSNDKCRDIIKNHNKLQAFINNDEELEEQKKAIKIALSMIEMKEELSNENKVKNRLKV